MRLTLSILFALIAGLYAAREVTRIKVQGDDLRIALYTLKTGII